MNANRVNVILRGRCANTARWGSGANGCKANFCAETVGIRVTVRRDDAGRDVAHVVIYGGERSAGVAHDLGEWDFTGRRDVVAQSGGVRP